MKRSMLGWLMAFGLWSMPLLAAGQYEFENCKTSDFSLKYNNLVANERAVGEAFNKMVEATGNTNMTDCYFMVPVANGKPVVGAPRRFVLYKNWDRIEIVGGLEKRVPQQHGMVVEYLVKDRVGIDGLVFSSREVVSLQVCRRPDVCQRLGVQR